MFFKKLFAIALAVAFLIQPFATAWAGEEPPKPGFLGAILGERIIFFKTGITAGVTYKKPGGSWKPYNPNKPIELKPGDTLMFDLMCENGRRSDQKMTNTLAVSDKPESGDAGMKIIHSWQGMFGTATYAIPKTYRGYEYFRVYSDTGTKDQNNYDGCAFYVGDPDEAQLSSGQLQPDLPTGPLGTLEISFMEQNPLRFSKVTIPSVTLYVNGKEIYKKENVKGFWPINGVPVGEISIGYKDNNKWIYQPGSVRKVEKDQKATLIIIRKEAK